MADVLIPGRGVVHGAAELPAIPAVSHRGSPERGRGLSVVFSRHKDTKKGLLEDRFFFQMPPTDTFRWSKGHSFVDYATVSAGQFTRESGRDLATISFSTLFADFDAAWAAWHFGTAKQLPPTDPLGWAGDLLELLDGGTPFCLAVGSPNYWDRWDIHNLAVTLRNLDVEERSGEPDTRYVDVQLVEWRGISLARAGRGLPMSVTLHEAGDIARWDDGAGSKSLKNPSLSRLAKAFYGSASQWRPIANSKKNAHLAAYAGRDLKLYVQRYGRGKKGHKTIKITIPQAPAAKGKPGSVEDLGALLSSGGGM